MLRQSYPDPLRAKTIKQRLKEEAGAVASEKTRTFLSQLQAEGLVRKAGCDWYFVLRGQESLMEEEGLP
jgi:hypothetical protein